MDTRKPIAFLGTALDDLREFPEGPRRDAGYQLDKVQQGLAPDDWKPFAGVGLGVCEIRIRDQAGVYRVMYVARFEEAIFVLHAFQKKTQRTSRADVRLAKARYQVLMRSRR